MSQCASILSHLKSGHRLTIMDAIELFNCYALSQRCSDLKRKGWPIQTLLISLPNKKRVAIYSMKPGAKCQA